MGVVDDSYIPFKDLVSLIAAAHSKDWDKQKDAVIAFLWTICLVEDWDSGTNDKTRSNYKQLTELLSGRLDTAQWQTRLKKEFPSFDDVRDSTSKASIIFRTLLGFNLARGGIDWLGRARSTNEPLEDHHIFPKDWINNNRDTGEERQTWIALRDSILNRLFVSRDANSLARSQTPPNYLAGLTHTQKGLPCKSQNPSLVPLPHQSSLKSSVIFLRTGTT
jgi:hypothetical protein